MALLRVCREFGCLPEDVEAMTPGKFLELVAYLKLCDDAERKAYEDARREADSRRR